MALAITACTHGKPIANVETALPATAQSVPLERVDALVIDTGKSRN